MSIEQVNQFYQVVLQNPELQLQFHLATDDESLAAMAVEVGQQHSYSFTAEEVIQAIALSQPPTETTDIVELADEQLEAVAGGKSSPGDVLGDAAARVVGGIGGTFHAIGQGIAGQHPDFGKVISQDTNAVRPAVTAAIKGRLWPLLP